MKYENSNLSNLPSELKEYKSWLLWRSELNETESKPRKIPYWTNGKKRFGKQGESSDLEALKAFDEAISAL